MRKPSFSVCPEGATAIAVTSFSALFFAILDIPCLAIAFWILCLFSVHFFRDPERVPAQEKDIALSPADGKVIRIEKKNDPFNGKSSTCISIFMSVFNVHVNRSPINCEVEAIRYFPGKFFNASLDKASEDNERCAWLLRAHDQNLWCMVQIAGLIARRIVCRAEVGDHLHMGQRLGMIRFGSRVDLYLPESYSPTVELGCRVYGGETIIARKN